MSTRSRANLATLLVAILICFETIGAQDEPWTDEDVFAVMKLVEDDLAQLDSYKYPTRLTRILHDLSTIESANIKGLDRKQLVGKHPELAATVDFLMLPNQHKITTLIDDLFQIVTSNCKSEVQEMEKNLKKLSTNRGELRTLVSIFHTYEIDCVYNAIL